MGNIADEILTEEEIIRLAEDELEYTEEEHEQALADADAEWMYEAMNYDAITEMWNDASYYDF